MARKPSETTGARTRGTAPPPQQEALAPTERKAAAKPRAGSRKTVKAGGGAIALPGRVRAVIEGVTPEVDCGRYPIKRVVGETVQVEADIFGDGHDRVTADLLYRREADSHWQRVPMRPLVNDRWRGGFPVEEMGRYLYTLEAWTDHYGTWRADLTKRREAGQDLRMAFAIGAGFLRDAAARANREDKSLLTGWARQLESADAESAYALAQEPELAATVRRYPDPHTVDRFPAELPVIVDRERARYSTWYELFPRSTSGDMRRHGTFKDVEARLPYLAELGFDVLYLPPIHPIGRAFRKGRNNAVEAQPGEVGSPWAIGAEEGGHKAVHPELGTLKDFQRLVKRAGETGIEIALDIAFQASPDHPYVQQHPEWFAKRPDGSIQYAENPPKKYQDIYPFHFETDDWQGLWAELKSVFEFWIAQGVKIFRVDNPHTKSFRFWEWCIAELKREHPELIFLSEAFTRPKVMHRLAKLGFTQSYTYFTWRNSKAELIEYFTELSQARGREYFRPNLWPNTPDILHETLQVGGRPAFVVRFILAATLGANYGIYGPAFELGEHRPREAGSEEYLDSEKYQLRAWDLDHPDSLRELIARVNAIRRQYPALQHDWGLRFHDIDNAQLLAYSKTAPGGEDAVIVVLNLDVHHAHSGWLSLPLEQFGLHPQEQYQVEDLLSGETYLWTGERNYVALDPHGRSAHILRLKRRVGREQDFLNYS